MCVHVSLLKSLRDRNSLLDLTWQFNETRHIMPWVCIQNTWARQRTPAVFINHKHLEITKTFIKLDSLTFLSSLKSLCTHNFHGLLEVYILCEFCHVILCDFQRKLQFACQPDIDKCMYRKSLNSLQDILIIHWGNSVSQNSSKNWASSSFV